MCYQYHSNSKLTYLQRKEMIEKYLDGNYLSIKSLSEEYSISTKTFYIWLKRFKEEWYQWLHNNKTNPWEQKTKKPTDHLTRKILKYKAKTGKSAKYIYYKLKRDKSKYQEIDKKQYEEYKLLNISKIYRILKKHWLNKNRKKQKSYQEFSKKQLWYWHIDIKELTALKKWEKKEYLFAYIERITREVRIKVFDKATTENAEMFLWCVNRSLNYRIRKILTDNWLQFTMKYAYNKKWRTKFERMCDKLSIEHKTIKPYHPWTNWMVERLNWIIEQEVLTKIHFETSEERKYQLKLFEMYFNNDRMNCALEWLSPKEFKDKLFWKDRYLILN